MKLSNILALNACIAIPLAVGGVAGMITANRLVTWYDLLVKPPFNPPSWIFGPVWTLLYILMGFSFFLVWRSSAGKARRTALGWSGMQLALNFAWSILFFQCRMPGMALLEILLLWGTILVMIRMYRRISKTAAWLQVPYILWVTFAAVLNGAIWWLNR